MRVTILGCGASTGVPVIGNDWGECDPLEEKNRRLRSSILIEQGDDTILVDTGPDLRAQLLKINKSNISAVFYTHFHSDHISGMDDLRGLYYQMQRPIPIYADPDTMAQLKIRFSYLFRHSKEGLYQPLVDSQMIEHGCPVKIGDIEVIPFAQDHYSCTSFGYRFNNIAYSTDLVKLDKDAFDILKGIDVWIVESLQEKPHVSHVHLERTLEWIERVKPRKAYLTHMNYRMDYQTLKKKLPPHVSPSYDGLVIEG